MDRVLDRSLPRHSYSHSLILRYTYSHTLSFALTHTHTGWYDTWGSPHRTRSTFDLAYAVCAWVACGGGGVNYYMYFGGTNTARETTMYLQVGACLNGQSLEFREFVYVCVCSVYVDMCVCVYVYRSISECE